jgi:hypothetical protein
MEKTFLFSDVFVVHFHFKANAFYEWKTGFSYEIVVVPKGK